MRIMFVNGLCETGVSLTPKSVPILLLEYIPNLSHPRLATTVPTPSFSPRKMTRALGLVRKVQEENGHE